VRSVNQVASGEVVSRANDKDAPDTDTPVESTLSYSTGQAAGANTENASAGGVGSAPTLSDDSMASGDTITPPAASSGTWRGHPDDFDELKTIATDNYARGEEIARGGMGRVIRARDRHLGRSVAIKELLSQNADAETRFEREIRITSRLAHPSIINVQEAGRWPSGELFYSMRYVDGRPLRAAIAGAKTLTQRLSLLHNVIAATDALAYAHDNGVVHRDLKPANILVGAFGETVVIDWGLAKELGTSDTSSTSAPATDPADASLTIVGQAMGTPAYMPPEQARGLAVDQRADVYALGAMLYHVLAGKPPYADRKPQSARELLDLVTEEAPRPLTEVISGVAPDLATIVAKAMARDPDERYPTAKQLAKDLRRFETGKRVGSHQYAISTLVLRWVRQHRLAVAVAACAAVALAVTSVLAVQRVRSQRSRAQDQERLAKENRGEVEELLDFMLVDLRKKLDGVGKVGLLDMVAKRAERYYARRSRTGDTPADTHRRANALATAANALREQGKLAPALAKYRAAVTTYEQLTETANGRPEWDLELATLRDRVGIVLREQGKFGDARAQFLSALAVRRRLSNDAPGNIERLSELAISHERLGSMSGKQGDLKASLTSHLAALAIRERTVTSRPKKHTLRRRLFVSHIQVGGVYRNQGKLDLALKHYRQAKGTVQHLLRIDSTHAKWQQDMVACHGRISSVLREKRDFPGALAAARDMLKMAKRLARHDPTNATWQRNLSVSHVRVGYMLHAQKQLRLAEDQFRAAQAIVKKLVSTDTSNATWKHDLLTSHLRMGSTLRDRNQLDAALSEFRKALTLATKLTKKEPSSSRWQRKLAISHARVGGILAKKKDYDGALKAYLVSTGLRETRLRKRPTEPGRIHLLGQAYVALASIQLARKEAKAAKRVLRKCVALYANGPAKPTHLFTAASCHALLGKKDAAFSLLSRAQAGGWRDIDFLRNEPSLDAFRADPRWKQLSVKPPEPR